MNESQVGWIHATALLARFHLRRRGQHLERSFEHILDEGGLRRATLRGRENLNKRHKLAAACYNLSQLLRRLHGIGTSRQWLATKSSQLETLCACFKYLLQAFVHFPRKISDLILPNKHLG